MCMLGTMHVYMLECLVLYIYYFSVGVCKMIVCAYYELCLLGQGRELVNLSLLLMICYR